MVLAVGIVLLGERIGWMDPDLRLFWTLTFPTVMILIGVRMTGGGLRSPRSRTYWAVMGGAKHNAAGQPLRDLAVIGINMGGADLDLRESEVHDSGEVLLDLYAVMGGVDVKLPPGVTAVCDWSGLMGGLEFFGRKTGAVADAQTITAGTGPLVRIRAHTVMGGVKVVG